MGRRHSTHQSGTTLWQRQTEITILSIFAVKIIMFLNNLDGPSSYAISFRLYKRISEQYNDKTILDCVKSAISIFFGFDSLADLFANLTFFQPQPW